MRPLRNATALVTGASRGIGVHIADALAERGMNLVLVARSERELDDVANRLRTERGARVLTIAFDLAQLERLDALAERAERAFGGVDVLVNNAGLERFGRYTELDAEDVRACLRVNLEAPMLLTRALLPGMMRRSRGHIVSIASLAGLTGTPFGEAYAASKHGLVGFTRSLHLSFVAERAPLGCSVVCPSFVADTGMYREMEKRTGVRARGTFRPCPPKAVARAVVRAIEHDQLEVVVGTSPLRPLLAVATLFPRFPDWVAKRTGMLDLLEKVADQRLGEP